VDDAEWITLLSSIGYSPGPGAFADVETADGPRALSMGENEDELIVTTDDEVLRLCWGGRGTACEPSERNGIVGIYGFNLKGVDVLHAKEALLICEAKGTGYGWGTVRLCR